MAKDLIVGSAGLQGFENSIAKFLKARGLRADIAVWLGGKETVAEISCLNGAAILEFLQQAARLEGYDDEDEGVAAGEAGELNSKNLPWSDNSLWLPVEFDNPGGLDDDPTFFIGSCRSLITELDGIQKRSSMQLGQTVPGYSDMRADFLKFIRSNAVLDLSPEDRVRWVWQALRDGAEIAVRNNAPLWLGPD